MFPQLELWTEEASGKSEICCPSRHQIMPIDVYWDRARPFLGLNGSCQIDHFIAFVVKKADSNFVKDERLSSNNVEKVLA